MGTKSKSKMSLRDKLAARRKSLKDKSSGYKFFMIKEGTTRMRPVPVGEEQDWALEVVYFYLGKDLGGVVSPATFGEKCALMNAHNKLSQSKKEDDRKFAKETLRPSKKYFVAHIRYKDEGGKELDDQAGVKPLILTAGQYGELLDLYLDTSEAGDFTDPINGYDIKYSRTGKGRNDTEYTLRPCRPTKTPKQFRGPYNIEELIRAITPSYEETKELLDKFLNMDHEEPEQEEEKPRKKSTDKKKSKKNSDL